MEEENGNFLVAENLLHNFEHFFKVSDAYLAKCLRLGDRLGDVKYIRKTVLKLE